MSLTFTTPAATAAAAEVRPAPEAGIPLLAAAFLAAAAVAGFNLMIWTTATAGMGMTLAMTGTPPTVVSAGGVAAVSMLVPFLALPVLGALQWVTNRSLAAFYALTLMATLAAIVGAHLCAANRDTVEMLSLMQAVTAATIMTVAGISRRPY